MSDAGFERRMALLLKAETALRDQRSYILSTDRQLTEAEVRQLRDVWEKICRGEISPNPRVHWLQRLLRWWT